MSSVAVARPATPAPMTVTRKALAPERMEVVYRAVAGAHRKAVRRGEGALQIAVRVAHRGFEIAALGEAGGDGGGERAAGAGGGAGGDRKSVVEGKWGSVR